MGSRLVPCNFLRFYPTLRPHDFASFKVVVAKLDCRWGLWPQKISPETLLDFFIDITRFLYGSHDSLAWLSNSALFIFQLLICLSPSCFEAIYSFFLSSLSPHEWQHHFDLLALVCCSDPCFDSILGWYMILSYLICKFTHLVTCTFYVCS